MYKSDLLPRLRWSVCSVLDKSVTILSSCRLQYLCTLALIYVLVHSLFAYDQSTTVFFQTEIQIEYLLLLYSVHILKLDMTAILSFLGGMWFHHRNEFKSASTYSPHEKKGVERYPYALVTLVRDGNFCFLPIFDLCKLLPKIGHVPHFNVMGV